MHNTTQHSTYLPTYVGNGQKMLQLSAVTSEISDHQKPSMMGDWPEVAFTAEGNGWTTKTLSTALRSVISTQAGPGAVVYHLRRLSETPAPTTNGHGKPKTAPGTSHQICTEHTNCHLCYCEVCPPNCTAPHPHNRYPTHHQPVPMPDNTRKQIWSAIASTRIPD